jgi:hypothetical protein
MVSVFLVYVIIGWKLFLFDVSLQEVYEMNLGLLLVIIIVVASLVFTLFLAGKSDEGYSKATKRNTTNLSIIYIVVILLSFMAVGVYIKWFA